MGLQEKDPRRRKMLRTGAVVVGGLIFAVTVLKVPEDTPKTKDSPKSEDSSRWQRVEIPADGQAHRFTMPPYSKPASGLDDVFFFNTSDDFVAVTLRWDPQTTEPSVGKAGEPAPRVGFQDISPQFVPNPALMQRPINGLQITEKDPAYPFYKKFLQYLERTKIYADRPRQFSQSVILFKPFRTKEVALVLEQGIMTIDGKPTPQINLPIKFRFAR